MRFALGCAIFRPRFANMLDLVAVSDVLRAFLVQLLAANDRLPGFHLPVKIGEHQLLRLLPGVPAGLLHLSTFSFFPQNLPHVEMGILTVHRLYCKRISRPVDFPNQISVVENLAERDAVVRKVRRGSRSP